MIRYILLTLVSFLITPVLVNAQDQMPEGMYEKQIKMNLGCTEGFMAMVLFVNEKKTTSTLVITKNLKDKEEACIVWAGQSNGTSLSINPNPIFPVET